MLSGNPFRYKYCWCSLDPQTLLTWSDKLLLVRVLQSLTWDTHPSASSSTHPFSSTVPQTRLASSAARIRDKTLRERARAQFCPPSAAPCVIPTAACAPADPHSCTKAAGSSKDRWRSPRAEPLVLSGCGMSLYFCENLTDDVLHLCEMPQWPLYLHEKDNFERLLLSSQHGERGVLYWGGAGASSAIARRRTPMECHSPARGGGRKVSVCKGAGQRRSDWPLQSRSRGRPLGQSQSSSPG